MRKRGLCCRRCLSVCLSLSCILSRRLKISANFFVGPVAHHSSFFWSPAPLPNSQGESFQRLHKTEGVGKFCDFRLKSPYISETLRDRPMVTIVGESIRVGSDDLKWPVTRISMSLCSYGLRLSRPHKCNKINMSPRRLSHLFYVILFYCSGPHMCNKIFYNNCATNFNANI